MPSNAERGARAKGRTKQWLTKQGFQVADLEVVRWIFKPSGDKFPVKRDQLGADLLAMNSTDIIFVQVKSGEMARTGNFQDARRKFAEFVFPVNAKRWVVAWPIGARQPRVVDCSVPPPPKPAVLF